MLPHYYLGLYFLLRLRRVSLSLYVFVDRIDVGYYPYKFLIVPYIFDATYLGVYF